MTTLTVQGVRTALNKCGLASVPLVVPKSVRYNAHHHLR
jgi:hypothetical protein